MIGSTALLVPRALNSTSLLVLLLLLQTIVAVQPFSTGHTSLLASATTTRAIYICQRRRRRAPADSCWMKSVQALLSIRDENGEESETNDPAYDITLNLFPEDKRTRRESSFADGERSEMNDRPPPSSLSRNTFFASKFEVGSESTASNTLNTRQGRKRSTKDDHASALYRKVLSRRKQSLTQKKFATNEVGEDAGGQRQKSSSFAREQLSELNYRNSRRNQSSRSDQDETRLDITSIFPYDRPSLLVNTGTKKEWTTSGSYRESKDQVSDEHGGSRDSSSTSSSSSKRKNVVDDDESFDITKQHFGTDRATFSLRVNSGMRERRGTHSGQVTPRSYVEGYRNIAHNFSTNRASLTGHPPPRKVVHAKNSASTPEADGEKEKEVYLDKHRFSYNSSPASVSGSTSTTVSSSSKVTTNAIWRKGNAITSPSFSYSETDEEICLDTPRAFVKNLDMIPSIKRGPTEANKYLDNNSFLWNTDSSKRKLPTGSSQQQQPYLDKPRPFQSNVDMVSSNFSGAKFKRSSDIPPELKNIKDYYDMTMSSTGMMEDNKMVDLNASQNESSDSWLDNSDPFDITRARFSKKLERTSSIIRDGNMITSKTRRTNIPSVVETINHDSSKDSFSRKVENEEVRHEEDDQMIVQSSSSFDDVMHWLLTHLPNLQEEDAISYFHHLLEDGFDSVDNLRELREEDLRFMKKGHRRAMMRSVGMREHDEIEDDIAEVTDDELKSAGETMLNVNESEESNAQLQRGGEQTIIATETVGEDSDVEGESEESAEDDS